MAEAVAQGVADEGIVCCWTGTGASIAANKVPGIRAALCHDAETARGARIWNHANVLALSLRATSEPLAKEILDAWFATPYSEDEWNRRQIERISQLEARHVISNVLPSGERFFAALRMTCPGHTRVCHSERSEESLAKEKEEK